MTGDLFLTVEGIDGAGKSTQARRLADWLGAQGHDVVRTREPGGSPGAEQIRALLVDSDAEDWSAETELLLFTAARRDHVEKLIAPALAAGQVVLCDRYIDSTRAYQAAARGMVDQLHRLMIGRDPDLTLLFDMPPATARARAAERVSANTDAPAEDRFEQRGLAFQESLRQSFLELAAEAPERIRIIDADADPDTVFARACAAVRDHLDG